MEATILVIDYKLDNSAQRQHLHNEEDDNYWFSLYHFLKVSIILITSFEGLEIVYQIETTLIIIRNHFWLDFTALRSTWIVYGEIYLLDLCGSFLWTKGYRSGYPQGDTILYKRKRKLAHHRFCWWDPSTLILIKSRLSIKKTITPTLLNTSLLPTRHGGLLRFLWQGRIPVGSYPNEKLV